MPNFKNGKPIAGISAALLGFGRANRAAAEYLLSHGVHLCVYAKDPVDPGVRAMLEAAGVAFMIGPFPSVFRESLLVRSPGIRPDLACITASLRAGAELTGETELFLNACPCPVIGVTGSDGKTTTSALIAALLKGDGKRVFLGGNNGHPLLRELGHMTPSDYAVVELSSFQLMTVQKSPRIAVITNLTPNHLNWHLNFEEYRDAKCRIFDRGAVRLCVNAQDAETAAIGRAYTGKAEVSFFALTENGVRQIPHECDAVFADGESVVLRSGRTERVFPCLRAFNLPGTYNLQNLLSAFAAVGEFLSPGEAVFESLRAFRAPKHRLTHVGNVAGVDYYDSSIDTSPSRTAAALSAVAGKPLVIAGGRTKGISLQPLGDSLSARACAVFLYGEAAEQIERAVGGRIPCRRFARFREAFFAAAAAARSGDSVLLSPGCTAFGEFRDFEERGEVFCRLVEELSEERIQKNSGTGRENSQDGGSDERDRL